MKQFTVYALNFGYRRYITTNICDMVKFSLMVGEFGNAEVETEKSNCEIPLMFV